MLKTIRNYRKAYLVICLSLILVTKVIAEEAKIFSPPSKHKPIFDFRKKSSPKIKKEVVRKAKHSRSKTIRFIQASDIKSSTLEMEDYTLEIDDLLEVSVWQIPELQMDNIVVRPDGKISFPLIGDVQTQGKTIEGLKKEITQKLKLYIKAPQVAVMIREFGGKNAVVLREGGGGGLIRFSRPITVMEALSLGGGISTESNTDRIFVIRDSYTTAPTVIIVNATSIYKQANITENIIIKSGDIIYVPRSFIHDVIYLMDTFFNPIMDYVGTYYGETWPRVRSGKWRQPSYVDPN